MKLPGILSMIQLGSGLIFAIPLGIIGIEFLTNGRPVFGAGFLLVAAAMLLLPEYVARRVGSPREWVLGRLPFRRGD
ncbi:DUF7533 family protein [Halalkalicoccus jeotgali]|uniref:Uncharacterized protein n=1 Tax=Halalkalicoccus jeotgali (strain DSM 18796 / CECT 7217 / JCM 14584 / KCTC 4019 / B3) TaxID=795797 RepID=D8J7R5_HALJB|nr:hypothetical protein [Halalkalicoccus jeotgali]ADJ16085.1 hypothetical protein HacjB3_13520 [Halalkalicoccus jeotgali B3]ELY38180.1 hypothetical protein C497_08729 [Halalkalicoccus jeotgali B3]